MDRRPRRPRFAILTAIARSSVWSRLWENAETIFWLASAGALATAFFTGPGTLRWFACSWLLLFGLLFALTNWTIVAGRLLDNRAQSLIPPIGGIFLLVASVRLPVRVARHSITWICLLDPCVIAIVVWPLLKVAAARRRSRTRRR